MFHKVARSLAGAGHEVVFIGPRAETRVDDHPGIRFIEIPQASSKRRRLLSVLRLIRLGARERAEVYLAPEPESWVAALLIKLRQGGRVVLDMHEHIPTEFAKFFPKPLQSVMVWMTIRFMRLFARFTDAIILTRNSFEEPWRGLSLPRVTVINTNHLQPPHALQPQEPACAYAAQPTILHQGLFGEERGSYPLLEAMKHLAREAPELRCLILGTYAYGDEAAYRRAIHEEGLDGIMTMLPAVPFAEVPAYIAAARVGLILFQPGPLNHTLAMPHKLFDYMREGKPVIAPDFAVEVAHIVREADCGLLIDVTDPRAIADAVLQLLRNPEEAARLGDNGRRAVETRYHWGEDERRLLCVFQNWERR